MNNRPTFLEIEMFMVYINMIKDNYIIFLSSLIRTSLSFEVILVSAWEMLPSLSLPPSLERHTTKGDNSLDPLTPE